MRRKTVLLAGMLLLAAGGVAPRDERANLLPKVHSGQVLIYLIHYRADKNVKTESSVAAPLAPTASQVDAHKFLRIEILDVQQIAGRLTIHSRTQFFAPSSDATAKRSSQEQNAEQPTSSTLNSIEFTIALDGSAEKITGLDALSTEEQQMWEEWLARFAAAWTFPAQGTRIGDKWKAEQTEQAASPIAGLSWTRDSEYVRKESCRVHHLSKTGEISPLGSPADNCAVVFSTAKLVQKSSPKDATPDDYKLHELKTAGTAKGTNEIITYISLTTGLVVRATEDASQQMDVIVAKADGSNRVHYTVDARSNSEVLLVSEAPSPRQ